ncbi:non-structural maintenance of chromosomes element 4 [Citrus sinensis]|uniref:non-structural maintenance of chromosomes element 4 homolog A-like isoform X1 n=1 Tax=Citrus sinensis TaxID=2711 RepID=UPI0021A1C67F|nr:non-structural maintenance of chromosomes element 4 homolog A-like isoform X1 [Citrus sinensis]XP_052299146.1 non-structural maintenance of chromosomes element 4 homolog A-like isoform X2 [Citrus sinensis]KAH9673898.1 non-structural maintenance of chromosomes element 4 [Citrus sinensis]
MVKNFKRELGGSSRSKSGGIAGEFEYDQDIAARRALRRNYRSVKSIIIDEREEITRTGSNKFKTIIKKLDNLHQQVQRPREQVADAETLLDITSAVVSSVQAENKDGITVSDFISCLLRDFGQTSGPSSSQEDIRTSVAWGDIGNAVPHLFTRNPGCCTMIGPMNKEYRQRKFAASIKCKRPTKIVQPAEVDGTATKERIDTDKNMLTMFNILRKNRRVRLEHLVLNRNSFAQTVENLFTLSFLVKDGRAEIVVDEKGFHLVSPKNAPSADAVASKVVSYNHFVFRFDFKDWKLMMSTVEVGEELMPHRTEVNISSSCEPAQVNEETLEIAPTMPTRKLSRNRGLVLPEQSVQETSLENEDAEVRAAAIRKGKRKVR